MLEPRNSAAAALDRHRSLGSDLDGAGGGQSLMMLARDDVALLAPGPRVFSQDDLDEAARLYAEGKSMRFLNRHFGIGHATLESLMNEAGIERRSPRGRRGRAVNPDERGSKGPIDIDY